MARKLTPEQHALIWSLEKLPQRDIAKRVGCSLGMVSKVLAGPAPEAPHAAPLPVEVDAALADAAELVAGDGSDDDAYARGLARLEVAGRLAEEARDVARMVSVQRAVALLVEKRAKARPAPVVDVNEAPDMLEAAKRFRERSHAVLDRLLAGVSK